jgi:hypothetical protein
VGAVGELVGKIGALFSALQETFEKQREASEAKREIWVLLEQRVGAMRGRGAGAFVVRKKVVPANLEPKWLARLLLGERLLSEPELSIVAEFFGETGRVWIWTVIGKERVTILDADLGKLTLRDVALMALLLEPSDFEAAKRAAEEERERSSELVERLKSAASAAKLLF